MKKSINVLVVEDEYLVAADIEESLIALGYKVQNTVASGQAAIDEVEKNLPDIILMDIFLKGKMNGIEAATIIQQKHDVPIIYLTANADIATVEKAKISLPYGYVLKPFTDKELQTIIEIAHYKFENDLKYKIESDQFHKFFRYGEKDKNELIVEAEKGLEKINIHDVYYIEQVLEYCHIYFLNDSLRVKESLGKLESNFPSSMFLRISNDHLINIDKIFLIKLPEIIIADKMSVITVEEPYLEQFKSRINT